MLLHPLKVLLLLHEQLVQLFELQGSHVRFKRFLVVLSVGQTVQLLEKLHHVVLVDLEIGAIPDGILAIEADQEIVTHLDILVDAFFNALLIVGVEDSEQQVHEQEESNRQVEDEED